MATKAEVRNRVGEELAIVPIGQTMEVQDQVRIDAAYDEVYARLKVKGLATWASTADVPTDIVPYFCLMVEEKLLTAYSVSEARYNRIKVDAGPNGNYAELKISELVRSEYTNESEPEDF